MTQDYRYTAFGLNFLSDIPFPELMESDGGIDVYINEVEKIDIDILQENEWFNVKKKRLVFIVDEVAAFEIVNGVQINYKPCNGCDLDNLRLFILGSSLAGVIHQRGLIPLHASSFLIDNQTILVTGDSGAGKSTTAFELNQRGGKLIADDVSIFNDKLEVVPGYPQMKLWQSSLDLFGVSNEGLRRVRKEDEKFRIIPAAFEDQPQKLDKIIFLERVEGEVEVKKVSGIELLELISRNVFRNYFIFDKEQHQVKLFKLLGEISKEVKCYLVKRNPETFQVKELVDLILEV